MFYGYRTCCFPILCWPLQSHQRPERCRSFGDWKRLGPFLSEENQPLKTLQRYANIDLSKMQKLCFREKTHPYHAKCSLSIFLTRNMFFERSSLRIFNINNITSDNIIIIINIIFVTNILIIISYYSSSSWSQTCSLIITNNTSRSWSLSTSPTAS